ncbi:hypothetical protein MMC34_007818 [Xylographa carneopallida]|nr:hypothetical protein [Xylographa carneopallida]
MAYPLNPHARAQSTHHGPARPASTLTAATTNASTLTTAPTAHPAIQDGYIATHPSHFYPSLFPPPTRALPLHPASNSPLAAFYHAAVVAVQQWTAHLHAWAAALHDALSQPPPLLPHPARGEETLHPHHFFPWLFDEPTVYFPLYVANEDELAGLYRGAVSAGRRWVGVRREWEVVQERAGEEEMGWKGVEEAAEGDGLWEQGRLDLERKRDEGALEEQLWREWRRLDEEAGREGA